MARGVWHLSGCLISLRWCPRPPRRPSGHPVLNDMARTSPVWPVTLSRWAPVFASQILTVTSSAAVARRRQGSTPQIREASEAHEHRAAALLGFSQAGEVQAPELDIPSLLAVARHPPSGAKQATNVLAVLHWLIVARLEQLGGRSPGLVRQAHCLIPPSR